MSMSIDLNIQQRVIGNRQHYLRWDSSQTPANLNDAGFKYDTTGSYADVAGFRYGVCYEFSMFEFLNGKKLDIQQRPLIVMEYTVISERYMGLGATENALQYMLALKETCFKYNGNFFLLWHNSFFDIELYKKLFKQLLGFKV